MLLAEAAADLEQGRLASAAARTASALVAAPTLPEAHQMVARLAACPGGGRDLFPLDPPLSLGRVVARAHIDAAEHDFDHALPLLAKAQAYAPEGPWADVPWVTQSATASAVSPAVVTNLAVDMLMVLRDLESRGADVPRAAFSPYLQLVRNTIAAHPDDANLLGAAGYLVRRFDAAEAAGYAARADQLAPCAASAIALGFIYRDLGRGGDALDAFERALGHDPRNLEVYADACDLLVKAGRLDDALVYARRCLAIDPAHVCCQASALGIQFRQTREKTHFDALTRLCEAQPEGTHASRHAVSVLKATVLATASEITVIRGSGSKIVKQVLRRSRKWQN
jgi:tetratricopeptide (TPR) repeat protein